MYENGNIAVSGEDILMEPLVSSLRLDPRYACSSFPRSWSVDDMIYGQLGREIDLSLPQRLRNESDRFKEIIMLRNSIH